MKKNNFKVLIWGLIFLNLLCMGFRLDLNLCSVRNTIERNDYFSPFDNYLVLQPLRYAKSEEYSEVIEIDTTIVYDSFDINILINILNERKIKYCVTNDSMILVEAVSVASATMVEIENERKNIRNRGYF